MGIFDVIPALFNHYISSVVCGSCTDINLPITTISFSDCLVFFNPIFSSNLFCHSYETILTPRRMAWIDCFSLTFQAFISPKAQMPPRMSGSMQHFNFSTAKLNDAVVCQHSCGIVNFHFKEKPFPIIVLIAPFIKHALSVLYPVLTGANFCYFLRKYSKPPLAMSPSPQPRAL